MRLCNNLSQVSICIWICSCVAGDILFFIIILVFHQRTPEAHVIATDDAEAGEAVVALEQFGVVAEMR